MSVREVDVVDYVYLEDDTQIPVLVVSDPLGWKEPDIDGHLELLREKLNSQIAFVDSGQINTLWEPYSGGMVRVEVIARHALTAEGYEFYRAAAEVMRESNIDLQFRLCDA